MNKKVIYNIVLTLLTVIIFITGVSYAYYIASFKVENPENSMSTITTDNNINVTAQFLFSSDNYDIYPGYKTSRQITITSDDKGNNPALITLNIQANLGVFEGDVTWKLYKSNYHFIDCESNVITSGLAKYDNASCDIPSSAKLIGNSMENVNLIIKPNTKNVYYLIIEYLNNGDQTDQQESDFTITLNVLDKGTTVFNAEVNPYNKCPEMNDDGSVNVLNSDYKYENLCAINDDYGLAYYYRGDVNNNYVKLGEYTSDVYTGHQHAGTDPFSKFYSSLEECQNDARYRVDCKLKFSKGTPIYWRIMRMNGDSSLRLVYDGTSPHENSDTSDDKSVENAYYTENYNDARDVGYMYGKRSSVVEDTKKYSTMTINKTTSYYFSKEYMSDMSSETITLTNSSSILASDLTSEYVGYYFYYTSEPQDMIYKIFNISESTSNSNYINVEYGRVKFYSKTKEEAQQNINDSFAKQEVDKWINYTNLMQYNLVDSTFCNDRSFGIRNYGTGAGGYTTFYHWYDLTTDKNEILSNISLKCPQQNDAFTVNNSKGNSNLTYPVGLISFTDATLAGDIADNSTTYNYLYSPGQNNYGILTMTPYDTSSVMVYNKSTTTAKTSNYGGIKPVININASLIKAGKGTMSNPYTIE